MGREARLVRDGICAMLKDPQGQLLRFLTAQEFSVLVSVRPAHALLTVPASAHPNSPFTLP